MTPSVLALAAAAVLFLSPDIVQVGKRAASGAFKFWGRGQTAVGLIASPTSPAPPGTVEYVKSIQDALPTENAAFVLECVAQGLSIHDAIKVAYNR